MTTTDKATQPDNTCTWEWDSHLTDEQSGAEVDSILGFDISDELVWEDGYREYIEYTAKLRWCPLGRAYMTRPIAIEVFGEDAVLNLEARASEAYQEERKADL